MRETVCTESWPLTVSLQGDRLRGTGVPLLLLPGGSVGAGVGEEDQGWNGDGGLRTG